MTGRIAQPRSTLKDYDLAIYIGRFQPFHEGHRKVLRQACDKAERVLVGVGSANRARDTRNPWLYLERRALIEQVIREIVEEDADPTVTIDVDEFESRVRALEARISIVPLNDTGYDNQAWIAQVQHAAQGATTALRPRICLIGNIHDATSEYLGWFPKWDYVAVDDHGFVRATLIRKHYFAGGVNFDATGWQNQGLDWPAFCPQATIEFLRRFRDNPIYAYLMKQKAAEEAYQKQWGKGPFQTVDAVIVQGGYVAMIERGGLEGEGSIGLPGGFLEAGEDLLWAAAREAVEETAIFIPVERLDDFNLWLEHSKTQDVPTPPYVEAAIRQLLTYHRGRGERFADPHRSRRGHLITEAFLFVLPDGHGLPHLEGCDDARRAFWQPISDVRPDNSFEDHAFIVDKMLSLHL